MVGVILDAIPATSQCTGPQENTSAADVARLRGQLTGMLLFVAQLILNFYVLIRSATLQRCGCGYQLPAGCNAERRLMCSSSSHSAASRTNEHSLTCCLICKSLITTLLFWARKVQAEDDGARCHRHNELDLL